jgi:predicted lipoprotein with Yx(FWY)xxD motif
MRISGKRWLIAAFAVVAVVLLLPLARSSAGSPARQGTLSAPLGAVAVARLATVKTTASGTVLANGAGYTLYWFSADTSASSACSATCIPEWPPVTGAPKQAPGVALPGRLGTFTRPDGVVQATYNGHQLYTFAGDFGPGDVGGDGVTQFGGTWHVARPA